ncbi:NACHT domain-containing protein [Actinoplanes sp. TBRC 11911]|uniref:NACHT domain-containing protein n=1 Tax=Actinoplanes sp. TBRC 11911 TaxID=2729386 RepID=UPI00145CD2BF|nr:NACHT domain-containing protein [Actinoplanes sp. TBRC 11911]NMO56107.1 NACHT domain-containing protein [Actinoplanes sp. TBRC 11911]
MDGLGSLLDTGDKLASIVGAVAGVAALWIAVRAGKRRRRRRDPRLAALLAAQIDDAGRHRYRFFGEHVPRLSELYVRSRATLGGDKPRTVAAARILDAHRHAVLLGDAGAGKSTFLATFAGDLARRRQGDIAVIVPAADLVGRSLGDALARAVHRDLAVELPAAVFERPPARGHCWRVLVDGLDEVAGTKSRSEVLWRIKGLLTGTGPYRFVLTGRPLAGPELAELHGPAVGVYDLRPFDRRELDEFAHRWFAARFPDDRRRADRTAGRFLARVAGARLGPVARVPLLATIAALVYEASGDRALPSSRAALYDRFVDHLLDGRGAPDPFRPHLAGLLRACGEAWLTDPSVRLITVAAGWLAEHAPHDLGPDRDRVVRDLLLATGVCTLRRDRVVFAHQSFAEYFAASFVDEASWITLAAGPATRSLAAFAVARRPDSDALIEALLRDEPIAAGDLLADGIAVAPRTRDRVVELLLNRVAGESEQAPEALRILGELSIDADVLARMSKLAGDATLPSWTRALVADRVADIDPANGHELLRTVAAQADEVVRAWIADTLEERGAGADPDLRLPLSADAVPVADGPLGVLAREALTRRVADARASEAERVAAAFRLAEGGDPAALRAMAEAPGIDAFHRVRLASALADAGDPELLRNLGAGWPYTTRWPPSTYAAALALYERGDPAAGEALRDVARARPNLPMAYGAAARCADLGNRAPLTSLAHQPGEILIRLAAARRLAALGAVRPLTGLLDDPQPPAVEATILAGLLEVGHAESVPRLRRLLDKHRFSPFQKLHLRYLLAANGDARSAEVLHRRTRGRTGSRLAIEAAIALTALGDPRGPQRLRRTAGSRSTRRRPRMRAATGLAQLDPAAGRQVLDQLAAPGSRRALRLRAATVALGILDDAGPLIRLAFDDTAPARHRAAAVELVTDPRLAALATTDGVPALVRAAACRLLPDAEARAVLTAIAAGDADVTARVAAMNRLDVLSRRAASTLFGRLLRDRRIPRLRRWWLAYTEGDLLSDADAAILNESPLPVVALVLRRPEKVLGRVLT